MKILKFFSLILLVSSISLTTLNAQEKPLKYRYELGAGISLFGSGDITCVSILNEFDYLVSKRLEGSLNFGFGKGLTRSNYLPVFSFSTFQGNINLYYIPLNINRYKLKLGTGLSVFVLNEAGTLVGSRGPNGEYIVHEYNLNDYTTLGYNLLIENEIMMHKQFSLAFLLYGQFYRSDDTNAGGMLKLGYNF